MTNGRMTFRFDTEKDKPVSRAVERWSAGTRETGAEKADRLLRKDKTSSEQTWTPPPVLPGVRDEPQVENAHYYFTSRELQLQDADLTGRVSGDMVPIVRELPDLSTDRKAESLPGLSFREEEDWRNPVQPVAEISSGGGWGGMELSEGGYGGSYQTRRPSHWWKFALSVAGAIGTGLLLGYAALSYFGGGNLGESAGKPAVETAAIQGQNRAGETSDPAGAGTSGLPISSSASVANAIPVQIQAQSYYLLQYGVFSSTDGAEQAQQELQAAGLAAGFDPEDGNRVYAGLSPDREQAKLLSSSLKNQGIELYVREVNLPSAETAVFSGNPETVNNYFAVSGELLGKLSGLSAVLLNDGGATSAADVSGVSNLHLQWTEAVKSLEKGLAPDAQTLCAELEKSISQGIAAFTEYDKGKAAGLLWEVQAAMMNFLTGQKELLAALA